MPIGKARRSATPAPEPVADQPADDALPAEATSEAEPETAETVVDDADATAEGQDATAEADGTDGAETAEGTEGIVFVERKPAGKRLRIAVVALAAVFVAACAFAGATLQPYLADRAIVATKLDVARTAASAITALWTYSPENMDGLPDRAARYLSGDFEASYRKYVDGIAPTNKQAQVSNNTQVLGAAVESLTPTDATALVYTNSTSTSPVTKNIPSLRYLSYRVTMERRGPQWLITKMTTVTSLDLTPKL
jgi:Mce-associated membrane protein